MNTSKLADYSEIIGSIAVVLSLIFVGIQLNDGNLETRAATTQAALQSEMDMRIGQLVDLPNVGVTAVLPLDIFTQP